MIKIKLYQNQTYEEIEKQPNNGLVFFKDEKEIIKIIYTHFAENIEQAIIYLTECTKFDLIDNTIFSFSKGGKTIFCYKQ